MAAGWNLSSGEVTRFHVDLDRYWAYFNYVFLDACSKVTTYKFGLIKAIILDQSPFVQSEFVGYSDDLMWKIWDYAHRQGYKVFDSGA